MLRRDFGIFIVKTFMPLFLLVMVVFATLFFPETLIQGANHPSDHGDYKCSAALGGQQSARRHRYTVAIEVVFYVFFGLCLMAMMSGYGHEQLRQRDMGRSAAVLDRSAKVLYAGTVCTMIALFYWRYGLR